MHQDSTDRAAEILRQAVPLMVKHQIPPTPYNYALWYSYVSNHDTQLKAAIDKTLDEHGTCPSSSTDELFRKHIIAEQLNDSDATREGLKALVAKLRLQVDEALIDTEEFHQLLDSSNSSLQQESDGVDLGGLIRALILGTQQASDSTRLFRKRMVETQKEVEMLRLELKRAQEEADRDSLSGLYNRRYFERYIDGLIERNEHKGKYLILVDIDHFKSFNDSYGHLVGDKVIERVATLMDKAAVGDGIAARYGGEEFLILISRDGIDSALIHAEKIRKLIQTIVLKDRRGGRDVRRITASFGVAELAAGESRQDWLDRADKALYAAKAQGRNRVISAG